MIALACIGDSITVGIGVPVEERFCSLLGGTGYGVPGASTADWSPDLEGFPPTPYPDAVGVVTLLLGANDATGFLEPEPIEADAFEVNLTAILDDLVSRGATRILLALPDAPYTPLVPGVQARVRSYRAPVDRLCETRPEVECVPPFAIPEEHMFDGGFHPDAEGHAIMAETFRAVLVPEPSAGKLTTAALCVLAWLRTWRR